LIRKEYTTKDGKSKFEKQVNAITQEDLLNKDTYIYVSNMKINCLLDTGAIDNYITKKLISKIGLVTITLKSPIERKTCLNETFWIQKKVVMNFTFKGKEYKEVMYVLPRRQDEMIILGKTWLKKSECEIDPVDNIEDIETLINILCQKGKREDIQE
ncbi:hypothetical protein NGRA_2660, partial [Nosema granulosis]